MNADARLLLLMVVLAALLLLLGCAAYRLLSTELRELRERVQQIEDATLHDPIDNDYR